MKKRSIFYPICFSALIILFTLFSATVYASVKKVTVSTRVSGKLEVKAVIPNEASQYSVSSPSDKSLSIQSVEWWCDDNFDEVIEYNGDNTFTPGTWRMFIEFRDPANALPEGSLNVTVGNWSEVSGEWDFILSDHGVKRFRSPDFDLIAYSGKCGDNVTWKFDKATGKLSITGSGPMSHYRKPVESIYEPVDDSLPITPWTRISSEIKEIEVADGITYIGDYPFCNLENLKKASLPFHLADIDETGPFSGCKKANVQFRLKGASVTGVTAKTYTGKEITQKPVVGNSSVVILKEGTDYTVSYKDNVNAGTASLTVTGKGRYTGTLTESFTIKKVSFANNSDIKIAAIPNQVYTGKAIRPDVTVTWKGTALIKGTDYTVSYRNNIKVGTALVAIKGKGNFTGTAGTTFRITRKSLVGAEIGGLKDRPYTGKYIKPALKIKLGSKVLQKGRDYKLVFKNNKEIGKARVTIQGIGNYKGSLTKTFSIIPYKTNLKKLQAVQKGFIVKWVRLKVPVSGYQVQYSTDKAFKTDVKTKRISGATANTCTIKKLAQNKLYYVRVRVYKKAGNKYYNSKWSITKKIKTK